MDRLEAAGFWWTPERPDDRVPGVLEFDTADGGRLKLIGGLRRPVDSAIKEELPNGVTKYSVRQDLVEETSNYGRILGECHNKAYTLEGCFQLSSRGGGFFGTADEEIIHVNNVYQGIWFSKDETAAGDILRFEVDGLTEWVSNSGMELTHYEGAADDELWAKLEAKRRPELRAALPHAGEMTLYHNLSYSVSTAISLSERYSLSFTYEQTRPVEELVDAASDFQDLISIATGRSAQFGKVRISHPDVADLPGAEPFAVWAAWHARRKKTDKPLKTQDIFFGLSDIGGMNGLASWMRVAEKYRSPLGRVMSTKYIDRAYVSDRFLNRAVALEGFDRIDTGIAQGRNFATRIKRCIDLAGPQFVTLVSDPERWAAELKHHRNELAHHYGRRMRENTEESFYIGDAAYWLFVFCLLRETGMDDSVLERMMNNPHLQFLARKNRALFA